MNTIKFMTMADEKPKIVNGSLHFRIITFSLPTSWAEKWVEKHTHKSLAEFIWTCSLAETYDLYFDAKINDVLTGEY